MYGKNSCDKYILLRRWSSIHSKTFIEFRTTSRSNTVIKIWLSWGIEDTPNSHSQNSKLKPPKQPYLSCYCSHTKNTILRISIFDWPICMFPLYHKCYVIYSLFCCWRQKKTKHHQWLNRCIRNLIMKIWKNNPWNMKMDMIWSCVFFVWLRKHERCGYFGGLSFDDGYFLCQSPQYHS